MIIFFSEAANAKVKVVDGDSFFLDGREIRLFGIDAPEYGQYCFDRYNNKYNCGREAAEVLKKLISSKVTCQKQTKDKYGRIVAVCFNEKDEINKSMVEKGWAVAYERYTNDYNFAEKSAKSKREGIWQGRFIRPELYRILQQKR